MKPDYSFIIAVRDRQDAFGRCLKSVLWQDYPSFEIIVVDYGSEPRIAVPDDYRIRIVRLNPESDAFINCVSFNAGIANARAKNLILMSCDNIVAPDLLSIIHTIVEKKQPQKLQIYWRRFDLTSLGQDWLTSFELSSEETIFQSAPSKFLIDRGFGQWHNLSSYGDFLMIKKEPIVAIGGFDERMSGWGWQDNDMMMRLNLLGYQKFWGKQFKLLHQFHSHQQTKSETHRRNRKMSSQGEAAGNIVRNGGPQNFEKYHLEDVA